MSTELIRPSPRAKLKRGRAKTVSGSRSHVEDGATLNESTMPVRHEEFSAFAFSNIENVVSQHLGANANLCGIASADVDTGQFDHAFNDFDTSVPSMSPLHSGALDLNFDNLQWYNDINHPPHATISALTVPSSETASVDPYSTSQMQTQLNRTEDTRLECSSAARETSSFTCLCNSLSIGSITDLHCYQASNQTHELNAVIGMARRGLAIAASCLSCNYCMNPRSSSHVLSVLFTIIVTIQMVFASCNRISSIF